MVKPASAGEPPTEFPGKAVMKESKQKSAGFKRGGGVKDCGTADGGMAKGGRMDKAPRKAAGGAATMRGRSPYSAASNVAAASTKTTH